MSASLDAVLGVGIGDAIRAAAVLYARYYPCVPPLRVACEVEGGSGSHHVMRNLSFVGEVELVERGPYAALNWQDRLQLQDPAEYIEQRMLPTKPLRPLPAGALMDHVDIGVGSFVVVQPHTKQWRELSLPVEQVPWGAIGADPIVLLGSGSDANEPFPTGKLRRVIDLRGRLSVSEAMSVVAQARLVVGVDSWACILGGLLEKAVWQFMHPDVYPLLGPVHDILFPTITSAALPRVETPTPPSP